jgi:hypothetical protein
VETEQKVDKPNRTDIQSQATEQVMNMQYSGSGLKMTEQFESLRLTPFRL